jgi:hypothetical protein
MLCGLRMHKLISVPTERGFCIYVTGNGAETRQGSTDWLRPRAGI